ncbi:MAG: MlaD family protein [Alphaproteobacteria bacterium]
METRASYLVVGSFTLAVIVALIAAVIWLANVQLDEDFAYYDIFFSGSVSGLKSGNPVRYRGIPVGVVTDMRIDPMNVEQVRVTIEVPVDTPIKSDSVASLEMQGITGVAYVLISGGTQPAEPLRRKAGEPRPVIPSKPSQLQELFDTAPELLNRFVAVVDRVQLLLNPANIESFGRTLQNVETLTGALAARSDDISGLVGDVSAMAKDMRVATQDARVTMSELQALSKDVRVAVPQLATKLETTLTIVNDEMGGLGTEAKDMLGSLRAASDNFAKASNELADLIGRNKRPIDDFASDGLYELTHLLSEARTLVSALTRISAKIERDPGLFLFGRSDPGVEVK